MTIKKEIIETLLKVKRFDLANTVAKTDSAFYTDSSVPRGFKFEEKDIPGGKRWTFRSKKELHSITKMFNDPWFHLHSQAFSGDETTITNSKHKTLDEAKTKATKVFSSASKFYGKP